MVTEPPTHNNSAHYPHTDRPGFPAPQTHANLENTMYNLLLIHEGTPILFRRAPKDNLGRFSHHKIVLSPKKESLDATKCLDQVQYKQCQVPYIVKVGYVE